MQRERIRLIARLGYCKKKKRERRAGFFSRQENEEIYDEEESGRRAASPLFVRRSPYIITPRSKISCLPTSLPCVLWAESWAVRSKKEKKKNVPFFIIIFFRMRLTEARLLGFCSVMVAVKNPIKTL